MPFGSRLRSLRLQRNETLYSLSAKARIGPAQLSRYERGLTPTIDALGRLARALNVDVTELAEPILRQAAAEVRS
jgi:transcriptional regulator with XRE-family HTH domain